MNSSVNWPVSLVVLLALLAACGRTRGAPLVESVEAAANRTLCPYTVVPDFHKDRQPALIKMIKCLSPDKRHASARHHRAHGHAASCLDVRAASQRAHCVELHDTRPVAYGALQTTQDVAVGCVCMFLEHGEAQDPEKALQAKA